MIDNISNDRFSLLGTGNWLHAGAEHFPEIGEALRKCADICFEINTLPPSRTSDRTRLFRKLLGSVGEKFLIHSPFRCDLGFNIHIGENFIGNFNLSILDEAPVNIGDNVMIGPNCSLITIMHALLQDQRNEGAMKALPVTICDNVWLAANVTVLPGVTIGEGAVIGAGSVVTRPIPAHTLAMGNPCRVVREISESDRIQRIL